MKSEILMRRFGENGTVIARRNGVTLLKYELTEKEKKHEKTTGIHTY